MVNLVAYTSTRLKLSDGLTLDTDAEVRCTGFADLEERVLGPAILPPTRSAKRDGT